jgi:LPS sulfotransferase NodH
VRRVVSLIEHSSGGFKPENIVWIVGTARTGSTWLGSMMRTLRGHRRWHEPGLRELFGSALHPRDDASTFKSSHKEDRLKSIRAIVLGEANARFAKRSKRVNQRAHYLVIQKPNGSTEVPWLLEAVPESRLIFLVRDPRDIVASQLDAYQKGSWAYMNYTPVVPDSDEHVQEVPHSLADTNPDAFVENAANRCLRDIGAVKRAYDLHRGPKVMVRYEGLRANTLGEMKRIYSTLGMEVVEEELARVVEKHSWENIPEGEKGKGKIRRKAIPGGWRDDLLPEQVALVETITAPLLKEFYPK